MIGLIQRVSEASVAVNGQTVGQIGCGLLVLVGVERHDSEESARRLLDRLLGYRVFPDAQGKMNLSLTDIGGELLLVPQFTLAADTHKGTRPSFSSAASPELGASLFAYFVAAARERHRPLSISLGETTSHSTRLQTTASKSLVIPQAGERGKESLRESHVYVASGVFGADMKVSLVNDGPVTFWLQVGKS